jgi:hypothetical protein
MKITREEHARIAEARNKGFMQGFAVAVGIVHTGFGETGLAKMVCDEGGFSLKSFFGNGIDPTDLEIIRHIFKKG